MIVDDLAGRARQVPNGPRVLLFDLERLSGLTKPRRIWHPRDAQRWNYWPPEEWERLPTTLCGSYQWLGSKRVHFVAAWDNPDDHYHVAREFLRLQDEATHTITFNGDRADLRWLEGDRAQAGLPDPSPSRSIDLFKLQPKFAFERKSLRHLLERLDLPNKTGHYDPDQADAAFAGDPKARRSMATYNRGDTKVLVDLFMRTRTKLGLNFNAYFADAAEVLRCPCCMAVDTLKAYGWYTANVQSYGRLRCEECGVFAANQHVKARARVRAIR